MKKLAHVSSEGITVPFSVQGDSPFTDSVMNHSFWGNYALGDVSQSEQQAELDPSIAIVQSPHQTYSIEDRIITSDQEHVISTIKFITHFLEQERQRAGIYTVHGNVMSLGRHAIASIGGISGIGKTSLSRHAFGHGWEWTSDEKFLMNESGQYIRGHADIQDDTKTIVAADGARPLSPREPREIAAFVIPIISNQALETHTYEPAKAEYHMYEELGRNITAGRAMLRGFDTPLPSFDTPEISKRRYACAQELASRVPMYFMMGEAPAILRQCEIILKSPE